MSVGAFPYGPPGGLPDSGQRGRPYCCVVSTASTAPVVLVVEDNAAMRTLIRSLVEPVSSAVHECADAETALELYARIHPDWVLMDVQMSGMDGIAATRAIRQSDPRARVIMVTEHGQPEYRRAAEAAGACGFVLKENLRELSTILTSKEAQDA